MLPLLASLALTVHGPPLIDVEQLRAHLDETIPARLERSGVPGVVVSVVEGDRLLLAQGWGWADLESRTPMDGEHTVVRVASISKTFTATAVTQLESQGRLDVDAPVSSQLSGMALPERFEPPVTVRHLLAHTGGFINNNVGRVSRTEPTESLADFIARTMPPQLRPPGRAVVYVNHGNALAGLVVEQTAGVPFADYVAAHILAPLRMDSSSFRWEPELAERMATGYVPDGDGWTPYEYLHFHTVPASTLHTTASDMGRYMILHLGDGRFEGREVLDAAAVERMKTPVPGIHPALPTYHRAFAHGHTAGHPTRSHGGSVPAFLSRMVLFDEHGVGVFVAQNSFGESLGRGVVESIAERFLPEPPVVEVEPAGDGRPVESSSLTGHYRRLGKADTPAFTRPVAVLTTSPLAVALDDEGFLTVDGDRFLRTGDDVFHRPREGRVPEAVVFVRDDDGEVREVHRGLSTAERIPRHASRGLHLLGLGLVAWLLLRAAVGFRGPAAMALDARARARLSTLAARVGLLGAVVPHLYVVWVDAGQEAYLRPLRFGMPGWLELVRMLIPVAMVMAWGGVLAARKGPPGSLRNAIGVALALTALPLWELYWRTPSPGLRLE